MKQLTIIRLIFQLIKALFKYGNEEVYYYVPSFGSKKLNAPLPVEEIKMMGKEEYHQEFLTIY